MHGEEDLLANAGLAAGESHDEKRAVGVGGVSPAGLVAFALGGIERLPGQRQAEIRSAGEGGVGVEHPADLAGAPEVILEARVLKLLGPEARVDGVADGLEKRAENRARDGVGRRPVHVDFDRGGQGLSGRGRGEDGKKHEAAHR